HPPEVHCRSTMTGMRRALLLAGAALCLGAPARAQEQGDAWFGHDKALHFAASASIAVIAYGGTALVTDDRPTRLAVATGVGAALSGARLASGRSARDREEDDLQHEIDTQRVSVANLERHDEIKATGDEITLLRSWLDEAWSLRSKHEYDQVREVLERTRKQ